MFHTTSTFFVCFSYVITHPPQNTINLDYINEKRMYLIDL